MIHIENWMEQFLTALRSLFGERLWFVGLQGSYGRGEAAETSDIDVVVILDTLNMEDLEIYSRMLDSLPDRTLVCGFMSGKEELLHWEASDLFQFYYDTTPIIGSLDELLRFLDTKAVQRAIAIGVCNIYHGCVHNIVHEKSNEIVAALYKSARFTLQAIGFFKTGHYAKKKEVLSTQLEPMDRKILENGLYIKNCKVEEIADEQWRCMSNELLSWASHWIVKNESFGKINC